MYDRTIDSITYKEVKRIGIFETKEKCLDIILTFKNYEGFKDYPETCFEVFEYEVGREYWRDEFS